LGGGLWLTELYFGEFFALMGFVVSLNVCNAQDVFQAFRHHAPNPFDLPRVLSDE
jgi:hypothetical protein